MDTEKLNRWLTLGANIGVLAGIVFLALEIRQSNSIAIATTEIAVRESFAATNETVYSNPEFAALLVEARNPDAIFSATQQEMLGYFVARLTNTWVAIDRAYSNGMVSRGTLGVTVEDMKWTIDTYPGLRSNFEGWAAAYPSSTESELVRELLQYLGAE